MGIRIQPREIDIPEEDPFRNDLLSREEPAEVLTHLVRSIEGPCVLAVDAEWGAGKTTFLRLCELCRYRHNLHYADVRIMPMSVVTPTLRAAFPPELSA